ncbi:hypothetical protein E2C01_083225 [Portunus trituberculatus]|uniref:Uncharacterized protein n=1 Tax=Portunus trituberculatus TaxID=210409 RepID=A0A5B7J785_PORTR|nr:hypothetical protein [Portunus trituberculatus]
MLWGPRGRQAHGFESCPRSECRLGFLTQGNSFLADRTVQIWTTKDFSQKEHKSVRGNTDFS